MRKNMVLFIVTFLVIIATIFVSVIFFSQTKKISKACVNNNCFEVELAENTLQQSRGLMFRKNLDENKGMFFIFGKEAIYPFWMKNTLISLDIIWIKENPSAGSGQVVFISQNAQPCKTLNCQQIVPTKKAKYVLEINAGLTSKLGIKIGDEVIIKN